MQNQDPNCVRIIASQVELHSKITNSVASLILEFANNQSTSQWTRIGNMQSSGSILAALLGLLFSVLLSLTGKEMQSVSSFSLSAIGTLFVLLSCSLGTLIPALWFLFKLLWPARIINPREPTRLLRQIRENFPTESESDLKRIVFFLINVNDASIRSVNHVLSGNQKTYGKALVCTISALIFLPFTSTYVTLLHGFGLCFNLIVCILSIFFWIFTMMVLLFCRIGEVE